MAAWCLPESVTGVPGDGGHFYDVETGARKEMNWVPYARNQVWLKFKNAFESVHIHDSATEWVGELRSEWEEYPKGDNVPWFGTSFDGGGSGYSQNSPQTNGGEEIVYPWKKTNIDDAGATDLYNTFGCHVLDDIRDLAREVYEQWVAKQNSFFQSDAVTSLGSGEMSAAQEVAAAIRDGEVDGANAAALTAAAAAKQKEDDAAAASAQMGKYADIEFKEQCFLLAKIFELQDYRYRWEAQTVKPLPYQGGAPNACLMVDGDPYGFMNRLTTYKTQQTLLDISTADLSNLQPRIRLFKVKTDEAGNESSQEMNFDAHATSKDIELFLEKKGKRGFGAGIKEFTFAYEANNPFAIKKSISAKLTIFANTFDELLRDRARTAEDSYRYVDLALKTGGIGHEKQRELTQRMNPKEADVALENLSKLDFRLKAVVGLETPPGNGISDTNLWQALANSFVTLNLTPTTHQFEFDEMGRVNFTINYLAYVEDFFDQPSFSIFGDPAVTKRMYERQLRYKVHNKTCDAESMKQFNKDEAKDVQSDKNMALTHIFKGLMTGDKLRYVNVPFDKLERFLTEGPYYDMSWGVNSTMDIGELSNSQKSGMAAQIIEDIQSKEEKGDDGNSDDGPGLGAFLAGLTPWGDQEKGSQFLRDDKPTRDAEAGEVISRIATTLDSQQIVFFYVSDLIDIILEGIEMKLNPEDPAGNPGGMSAIIDAIAGAAHSNGPQGGLADQIATLTEQGQAAAAAGDTERAEEIMEDIAALQTEAEGAAMNANDSSEAQASAILDVGDLAGSEKRRFKRLYDNFKKLRVVLGPVEIVNHASPGDSKFVNFGDLPISVKYFMDWLLDKTVKKEQFDYPLPRFLNDFFNLFVRDFLNDDTCFGQNIKQKTRVNQAAITGYHKGTDEPNQDNITALISKQRQATNWQQISRLLMWTLDLPPFDAMGSLPFPILNTSGNSDDPRSFSTMLGDEYNYLVYFAGRTQPVEKMNGDKNEDGQNGIMHYMLGRDEGIIKNISLKRTEAPGLKEVRFEQEGYDGLNQLREVYDVTIDTYANVSAFPGTYIFVDPRGFVPNMSYEMAGAGFNVNDLSDYGLGGYYMIIRSENSFGPGKAHTTLTAKWVAEIHKNVGNESDEASDGSSAAPKPAKCFIEKNRGGADKGAMGGLMAFLGDPAADADTGSTEG